MQSMVNASMTAEMGATQGSKIQWAYFAREPFRIFFPLAVLSGIVGVALWPLHFWGAVESYPGLIHARIMVYGLFGGFIAGFLGTAMPRMLSAMPFRPIEVGILALGYIAMVICSTLRVETPCKYISSTASSSDPVRHR